MENCCSWQQKLDAGFKSLFYRIGFYIGERPGYFLLIPVLISLLLGTGLQQMTYENDPGYIFAPSNGKARTEREIIENLFPVDYTTGFNPSRFHRPGRYARLIITTQDSETLFRKDIWEELNDLDALVKNVRITHDEVTYNFQDLCAKYSNECYPNDILQLGQYMEQIETQQINLTYPITFLDGRAFALPQNFGGIQTLNLSHVTLCTSALAVQLNYFLDADSPKRDDRGEKWEKGLLEALERADKTWDWIRVDRFTERSLSDQMNENVLSTLPYAAVTAPLMVGFAIISCLMAGDWVRSKPWLGIVGVVTPTLGTLASFGLLCYCGVPMIGLNVAAPFLMMGIGMDDAFVILAAWRQTSVRDPVPKRLGEAYAEAAVSISITSLTDLLSFVIGIASPFVSIQIFSAYTATAVLATYILHIFFFGGAMALSGYHEAQNRHSLFWWLETTPKSKLKAQPRSFMYRLFFKGGIDPDDPTNPLDHPEHSFMVFFRDTWATALLKPWVKGLILFLFAIYLGVAGFGISQIEEGMEMKRIGTDGGYMKKYYDVDDKYFLVFPYRIQVVVTGNDDFDLTYSDKSVQAQIEKTTREMETTPYTEGGALYTESWLRSFLLYAQSQNLPIENEEQFIENLKNFFHDPTSGGALFELDVKFNENKNRIRATRFIIQTVNLTDWKDRRDMLTTLRDIAAAQQPEMRVTVFNPLFMFVDQFLVIRSSTIQLVCIAAAVMMVVSLIFIPNPVCSIWVALAVVSIEAGVLGFLSLWNVNLDVLSLIYLVMSIGFSVDFSAHISYAYMSNNKACSVEERLRSCLYALGLPILQGAVSTILGVVSLIFSPSYDFVAFFKAVFLVMVIATAHGILLLPVLLTIFGPKTQPKLKTDENEGTVVKGQANNNNNVE